MRIQAHDPPAQHGTLVPSVTVSLGSARTAPSSHPPSTVDAPYHTLAPPTGRQGQTVTPKGGGGVTPRGEGGVGFTSTEIRRPGSNVIGWPDAYASPRDSGAAEQTRAERKFVSPSLVSSLGLMSDRHKFSRGVPL